MHPVVSREIEQANCILFCALNWGLGHAARTIPIIEYARANNKKVILASDGGAFALWKVEFPDCVLLELPSLNIRYSTLFKFANIILQTAKYRSNINKDYSAVAKIVENYQPDLIISDHRPGCRHPSIRSLVIAHQLQVQSGLLTSLVSKIQAGMLNKFDHCWIPDTQDRSLAGDLSDNIGLKSSTYIGPLSRFAKTSQSNYARDILVVLSGPEPQRSLLEEKLLDTLQKSQYSYHLVRGVTKEDSLSQSENCTQLADRHQLNTLINTSKLVICRTGYTSVMDLVCLGKKAILIPTPGQTEQEYLGRHLEDYELFRIIRQDEVSTHLRSEIDHFLL